MSTQTAMAREVSEEGEVLSSPSSPEFLLPAFESSLQLSSSPLFGRAHEGCHDPEQPTTAEPSVGSRLRRLSRGHAGKKLARSPSCSATRSDTHSLLDAADIRKYKKAGKVKGARLGNDCRKLNHTGPLQSNDSHNLFTIFQRGTPRKWPQRPIEHLL